MEIKMMVEVRVVVKLDVVMEEKVGQLEGENTNTSQVMGISHLLKVIQLIHLFHITPASF